MRIYLLCELLHKPAIKNEKIIRFLLIPLLIYFVITNFKKM